MRDDIETPSFKVITESGETEFVCDDINKYQWMTDPAGTLFIYHSEHHKTFAAVKSKDQRIIALAAGEWKEVRVLGKEELDERQAM